mgnify:CR=1 FL=1
MATNVLYTSTPDKNPINASSPVAFQGMRYLFVSDLHYVLKQFDWVASVADRVDLLIFVSANAVRYAFPLMPDKIPLDLQVAAVGTATARALEEHGLDPTLVPDSRMDSEGLLALPALREELRVRLERLLSGRKFVFALLEKPRVRSPLSRAAEASRKSQVVTGG